MKNKTLGPLPQKQYTVMAPFVKVYEASLQELGFRRSSLGRSTDRPQTWDWVTTRYSKGLASGSRTPKACWEAINKSEIPYGSGYQYELMVRDFFGQFTEEQTPLREWPKGKSPWDYHSLEEQSKRLNLWKNVQTGYPVIDASMIQLRQEGFMSNRQRMTCASFLSKNLLVWWKRGEEWFADKLVDYHPSSNYGNWAWVSGAGFNTRLTDVMNPDIQRRKIDPQGSLALKYLPKGYDIEPAYKYDSTKKLWLRLAL